MAREPILAAGGIVVKRGMAPLIAVVRQRKRNEWVLPKGKLTSGESARAAAEREVLEETGHEVFVHEFLGTLAYESGGRIKIVNFWRMEAHSTQTRDLMNDVKAVVWLSLDEAVERLSRAYEREFLTHVGPPALQAAASLASLASRAKSQNTTKVTPGRNAISRPSPGPQPAMPDAMPEGDAGTAVDGASLREASAASYERATDILDAPALAPEFGAREIVARPATAAPTSILRKAWLWLTARIARN